MIRITTFAAALLAAAPAAAQQTQPVGFKDPGTATLVGVLVPGGGQLYAGETGKGLTILGVGMGGLLLGTALTASSVDVDCNDGDCADDTNYLPVAAGYAVSLGAWIYGIMDADDSAGRMNAKRGLARVLPAGVAPVVAAPPAGGAAVGLSITF